MVPQRDARAVAFTLAFLLAGKWAVAQDAPGVAVADPTQVYVTPGITAGARAGSDAQAPPAFNPYAGDLLSRYRLSGDW